MPVFLTTCKTNLPQLPRVSVQSISKDPVNVLVALKVQKDDARRRVDNAIRQHGYDHPVSAATNHFFKLSIEDHSKYALSAQVVGPLPNNPSKADLDLAQKRLSIVGKTQDRLFDRVIEAEKAYQRISTLENKKILNFWTQRYDKVTESFYARCNAMAELSTRYRNYTPQGSVQVLDEFNNTLWEKFPNKTPEQTSQIRNARESYEYQKVSELESERT